MDTNSQQPKEGNNSLSSLNVIIQSLNLAKDLCDIAPAKVVFGCVSSLLTMIRVRHSLFSDDELQTHTHPGLDG